MNQKFPLLLLVVFVQYTSSIQGAEIVSLDETLTVRESDAAYFKCSVKDVGIEEVIWTFETHYVIYDGHKLLNNDRIRYSINPSNTVDGVTEYNLMILYVNNLDQGQYSCSIKNSDQKITSTLRIIGVPDRAEKTQNINVTDCCIANGISSTCLPACYPEDIDLDVFDPLDACPQLNDLLGLSKCFTAGSNHEQCCRLSNVDELCLPFCRSDFSGNLSEDHLVCYFKDENINGIIDCFAANYDEVPSQPREMQVIPKSSGEQASILIKWKPPSRNVDKVQAYRILYRKVSDTFFYSHTLSSSYSQYTLTSDFVQPGESYIVYLVAVAQHGISLETESITVYIPFLNSQGDEHDQNIAECCDRRKVPEDCRNYLCTSRTFSFLNHEALVHCFSYLDDVFTCLAGERNHSSCCSSYISPECVPLCSGKSLDFNSPDYIVCVQELHFVHACIQDGYDDQPAPPTNLYLEEVTSVTVYISFTASESNFVRQYMVELRKGSMDKKFYLRDTLEPTADGLVLRGLEPNTQYTVRILAEADNAGSLPSEYLSFVTYPTWTERATPPPVVNLPHNITQCCEDSGMPSDCVGGCYYGIDMTNYFRTRLSTCYPHIGTVLACAADGRDHQECCKASEVIPQCLPLCMYTTRGKLSDEYIVCLADTGKAVNCFEEGVKSLPRHPDVSVVNVTHTSISLEFTYPEAWIAADFYVITYSIVNFMATKIDTNTSYNILQNLKPGTYYTISVQSVNMNGTSAPSPNITVSTLKEDELKAPTITAPTDDGHKLWENIEACCSGIDEKCSDRCVNKVHPDSVVGTDCANTTHIMMACYVDGKDFSQCCSERLLPSYCIPLCRGSYQYQPSANTASCLSEGYRNIILGCVLDNQGLVPSAPSQLVVEVRYEGVYVSWMKPKYFCPTADCYFNIHYWRTDDESSRAIINVKNSNHTIKNIVRGHTYTFAVTASNSYGTGRTSSVQTLYVQEKKPVAKVYLRAYTKYVIRNQRAELECRYWDFNPSTKKKIVWKFYNTTVLGADDHHELLGDNSILAITKVDERRDEGEYYCQVSDVQNSVWASLFLSVQYKPYVDRIRDDTVEPNKKLTAILACWFRGLPDNRQASFTMGNKPVPDTSKYSAAVDVRYHTGIVSYRLKIADVVESDYQNYSISVSNGFGTAECHISLKNPNDIEPVVPVPAPADPVACCQEDHVTPLCQELCSFNLDIENTLSEYKYISCLAYYDTYIKCAADGRDHTKCCKEKGVHSYCFPNCYGKATGDVYKDQDEMYRCVQETPKILQCLINGHKNIPMEPINPKVEAVSKSKLRFSWSEPKSNAHKVDQYDVFYKIGESGIIQHVSTNEHRMFYEEKNVDWSKTYSFYVRATNKYGSSHNTTAVTYHAGAPGKIDVVEITPNSALLAWKLILEVNVYVVTCSGPGHLVRNVSASKDRVLLTGLKEGSTYVCNIKALLLSGKYSQSSPNASFSTPIAKMKPPQNLKVEKIRPTQVTYSWSPVEGAKSYILHYKRHDDRAFTEIKGIIETTYTLKKMNSSTRYDVYVTTSQPQYSGLSNSLSFHTADESKDSDSSNAAIAIGVTLGIIALTAIIFLGAFLYIRWRKFSPKKVNETVTFENPGYGNQHIKIESPQTYGKLEEETLEHTYDNPSNMASAHMGHENPGYSINKEVSEVSADDIHPELPCETDT